MLQRPRLMRWSLLIGLIIAILAVLVWGLFQPWAANHFGYALPGEDHLPYRISYSGRDYSNPNECAGDTWCQPENKLCTSKEQLKDFNLWPLKQVGSIPTLFGTPHPIYAAPHTGQTPDLLLVFDDDDCYLLYSLEGGP